MNGERWLLNDSTVFYLDGTSEQGHIFKDDKTYNESLDSICYISEYSYEDYEYEIRSYIKSYIEGEMTIEELCESISESV